MKSILVTGGAGYIGSHTCIELIRKGFDVCIVDSLINSSEEVITQIKKIIKIEDHKNLNKLFFRKGDLRDKKFLSEVFQEFKNKNKQFDAVIHFAGIKSVEDSVNNPTKYWEHNLNSILILIEIMLSKERCFNLIYCCSETFYTLQKLLKYIIY